MALEKLILKVVLVQSLLLISSFLAAAKRDAQVPCYFIFGDSLVDNGNNNYIASLARANYQPYGIDFPGGPTGRFSNGLTTVDVIAQLLGFKNYIPPYATANRRQLLGGVNFASAAAGIRDETGRQLGARITMNGQVQNFRRAVNEIAGMLGGEDAAADHLRKCIFTVGMGSNDYLNNYFMPTYYSSNRRYTPEQWANVLIQEYTRQLRSLYNYGARKVAIIGVGQVGCSPSELARYSANGATCVTRINNAVQLFNNRTLSLVNDFNKNLKGASFTYINGYGIFQDIVGRASQYGLTHTNVGCCGVGRNNGQITCLPLQRPCRNRDEYVFWDAFHPTEKINVLFGRRAYRAQSRSDAHPIDIAGLAQR